MEFNYIKPIQSITSFTPLQSNTMKVNEEEGSSSLPFADIYNDMINNLKDAQAQKEEDAYNLAIGNADDLHTIMINASKATAALQLTVSVTNKALSAYNEIIKMNI